MPKLFFSLFLLLTISVSYGKGLEIKILLLNNTWFKANLLKSDEEGNLIVQLNKAEHIVRHKEFKIVEMASPPELTRAKALLKQNKTGEATKLLKLAAAKYNFPPLKQKIKVLQAQIEIAQTDPQSALSLLEPLLKDKMTVPEVESLSYAHAFLLLGNVYVKLEQQDNAAKAYRRSFELAIPEYSATANLMLGKILLKQKNTQDALDCFLENISVFSSKVPGRKLALEETIAIYKERKSKKLKLYEDMLKKEYPSKSK